MEHLSILLNDVGILGNLLEHSRRLISDSKAAKWLASCERADYPQISAVQIPDLRAPDVVAQEGGLVLRHVDALEPQGHLVRSPLLDRNAVQRLQQLPVVAALDLRLLVALHQVEAALLLKVNI